MLKINPTYTQQYKHPIYFKYYTHFDNMLWCVEK